MSSSQHSTVSTPHIIGRISLNDGGASSYFEIPLYPKFGDRDFPVSLIIPTSSTAILYNYGFLNCLLYLAWETDHFVLRRPNEPLTCFYYLSNNRYYCAETGEILVHDAYHFKQILYCENAVKAEFPENGGLVCRYRLPDGMWLHAGDSDISSSHIAFFSTEQCGDGIEYDVLMYFSSNGRTFADLTHLQIQISTENRTAPETLLDLTKSGNTFTISRWYSTDPNDCETGAYNITVTASGKPTAIVRAADDACFIERVGVTHGSSSNLEWTKMTAKIDGQIYASKKLEKLSEWLWKIIDEQGCEDFVYLKSPTNAFRVIEGSMRYNGACQRQYHDGQGRISAVSDPVPMDIGSNEALSMIPHGAFSGTNPPSEWTLFGPTTYSARSDLALPSIYGDKWIGLQHYGGYAQCQFSTLPLPGESCLVMALFGPSGNTSALTLRIDVSYVDGTSEFKSSYETFNSAANPSLIPVALEFVPLKPVASISVKLSVSDGPGYVKSVVAIRNAGIKRYQYLSSQTETVEKQSKGDLVTHYYYPSADDDFATYSYGSFPSPLVSYQGQTGLPERQIDDLGSEISNTYQTIPLISLTESKNYRLAQQITTSPSGGKTREAYTYHNLTWKLTSSESEGISRTFSGVYFDEPTTVVVAGKTENVHFDEFRRLDYHRIIQNNDAVYTIFSYGTDKTSSTVHDGDLLQAVFVKDTIGRPAEVSSQFGNVALLKENYEYDDASVGKPLGTVYFYGSAFYYRYEWECVAQPITLTSLELHCSDNSSCEWNFTYKYGAELPFDEVLSSNQYSLSNTISCGGAICDSVWKAEGTTYLSLHSGFGGEEWQMATGQSNFKLSTAESSYSAYVGDLKTWSYALAEEGFYASRLWKVGDQPVLYSANESTISSGTSAVCYRLSADKHVAIDLSNAAFSSFGTGLPKGVISFRPGLNILYIQCGSSTLTFTVQNGALNYLLPTSSGVVGNTKSGWNVLAFGFASSSQLLIALNGFVKTINLPYPFPAGNSPSFTFGQSAAVTYGQIALGAGTITSEKLIACSLLTLDCVSPDRTNASISAKKASSLAIQHVISGPYNDTALAPLDGTMACSNGSEPSFTLQPGVGLPGTTGGVQAYSCLTRPSSYGWSSEHNKPMWRAFGRKLSYPLDSCADFALQIKADSVIGTVTGVRTVVAIGTASKQIVVTLEGGKLYLKIMGNTAAGYVQFTPLIPITLTISTTYVPDPYEDDPYVIAYGLSCSGSIEGTIRKSQPVGSGRIYIGTNAAGLEPFNGLLGDLLFVPRSIGLSTAINMGSAGKNVGLETAYDDLGRIAYQEVRGPESIRGVSFDYETLNSSDVVYQTSRVSHVSIWYYGSIQAQFDYGYDSAGRLNSINNQTVSYNLRGYVTQGFGQTVSYNGSGNILSISNSPNVGNLTLGYSNGKLSSVVANGWTRSYSYNASAPGFPSSIQYVSGQGPTANTSFTYRGDLLYSASVGSSTVSYLYDSGGRVIRRTEGTDVRKYAYRGDHVILDSRSNGTVLFYVYDAMGNPGMLVERTSSGTIRRYSIHCDALGRILYIVPLGSVGGRAQYTYGLFGEIASISDTTGTGIGETNLLRYKAYLFDPLLQMYCLGRRHYDPTVGRFLEPDSAQWLDPKRFGGINPYAYCLNDPITKADRLGTFPLTALVLSTVFGALIAGGIEFGKQTYKGKDFYGIFDAKNWDFTNINTWEIASKALLGGFTGFAMAAGGTVGAAMYGMFKMSSTAMFVVTGIAAGANFFGGVGGYFLHATGCRDKYNVGSALAWGIGQLEKGAIAYVFGLVLGRGGAWKMGPDYGYFGNYKPVGALARIGRDAFARWLVRWPLSLAPNWFADEWFV